MKIFASLLIFFLSFGYLKGQNNPDSLIKRLKVIEVLINQGEKRAGIIQYDKNGNMIYDKYDDFASSTYLIVSSSRIYDRDQKLIQDKSTHSSYPNDTTILNYNYDRNRNLISINSKDKKDHALVNYVYDLSGKKIKVFQLSPSGDTISATTIHYDEKGNKKEEIIKMGSFATRLNKIYYDSLKREIKIESIENTKVRFASTTLYQSNTNLLLKVIYDEDGTGTELDGVKYKYDDKGRLVARLHFNLTKGKELITGEENFEYFDNNLIKTYSENIFTATHIKRMFIYSYKFNY